MKLVLYQYGKPVEVDLSGNQPNSLVLEVTTNQGQTVQLWVGQRGGESVEVDVRGWGNKPVLLGNLNSIHFHGPLPYEKPTHDENYNRLEEMDALQEAMP